MKKFELELAFSLIKSRRGHRYPNANVILSIIGIAVGILFLVFTISIYDGYVQKLETIIFSVFPQITLQADIIEDEDDTDDTDPFVYVPLQKREQETCEKICKSPAPMILNDKELSTATSLIKGKGFHLGKFDHIASLISNTKGIVKFSPVVFEEGPFFYKTTMSDQFSDKPQKLRVLGVQTDSDNHYVPEINRSIENSQVLQLLNNKQKHSAILSTRLYISLFGAIPDDIKAQKQQLLLRTQTFQNNMNKEKTLLLNVIDVFKLGVHQISENLMITSLDTAQEIFDTKQYASFLGIKLTQPHQAKIIAEKIKKKLKHEDMLVFNWLDVAADMFNNLNLYRNIIMTILAMSILIIGFIIYNTLHIMIIERKRQIGTLVSLGIKKGSIYRIFFIISQIEAISGFLTGSCIGIFAGHYFGKYLNQQLYEFLPIQNEDIVVHGWTLFGFFLFVSCVCLFTAFLSARKAVKIDPVQCLQSE